MRTCQQPKYNCNHRFAVGPRNYVMLFNKQAEAGE